MQPFARCLPPIHTHTPKPGKRREWGKSLGRGQTQSAPPPPLQPSPPGVRCFLSRREHSSSPWKPLQHPELPAALLQLRPPSGNLQSSVQPSKRFSSSGSASSLSLCFTIYHPSLPLSLSNHMSIPFSLHAFHLSSPYPALYGAQVSVSTRPLTLALPSSVQISGI